MSFELPIDTLCPNKITNAKGVNTLKYPGTRVFLSKNHDVFCRACSKKHTRDHFKGKNDEVYRIFSDAFNNKTNKTSEKIPDTVGEVKEVYISDNLLPIKKKPGRPPKPLDQDQHILDFEKSKEKWIKLTGDIANCYQALVDSKPRVDKGYKESISPAFKNILWIKLHGDIKYTKCPVCSTNNIYPDNYSCGHIFPEVYGGQLEIDNVMPICASCNSLMAEKHLYWFAWYRFKKILFKL